jgi:hypothetical protein
MPFGHAHQHHMRPLQPLGGVQGGQRDHVLVLLALADGGQQRNGLRHFQQAFLFVSVGTTPGRVVDLPPQRWAIQSQNSSTLVQRAAATFSLSSPSYRCFS